MCWAAEGSNTTELHLQPIHAMSITVENELATIEEATAILLEKMSASKVARLLATLQVGTGDYVKTRDLLFAGETVDSLFEQAKTAQ